MNVRRKDLDRFYIRSLKLVFAARKPWSRLFYESVGNSTYCESIKDEQSIIGFQAGVS